MSLKIQDNGTGILPEDMKLLCKRSHTSKSSDQPSFGFRGETLCFLSYISELSIESKQASSSPQIGSYSKGECLSLEQGNMLGNGTIIAAKNIYNTAKLRKTVLNDIIKVIKSYAINHNQVNFSLKENAKLLVNTIYFSNERARRALAFQNKKLDSSCVSIFDFSYSDVSVSCILSKPTATKNFYSKELIYFVNNRLTENNSLSSLIQRIYKEHYVYQYFAFIKVKVPLNKVDMNVNRQKTEAYFEGETELFKRLEEDLQAVLESNQQKYEIKEVTPRQSNSSAAKIREDETQTKVFVPLKPVEAVAGEQTVSTHVITEIFRKSSLVCYDSKFGTVFFQYDKHLYGGDLWTILNELLLSLSYRGGGHSIEIEGRVGWEILHEVAESHLEEYKDKIEKLSEIGFSLSREKTVIRGLIIGDLKEEDYFSWVGEIISDVLRHVDDLEEAESAMVNGVVQVVKAKIESSEGFLQNSIYPLIKRAFEFRKGCDVASLLDKKADLDSLYSHFERC